MLAWLAAVLVIGCADSLETEPQFMEPIENVSIPAGRDAQLNCAIDNLGTYRAAWIKVETKAILTIFEHIITRNYRISLSHSDNRNFVLQIRNVRESDRGGYMCQLNTVPMKSQIAYLDVLTPPIIEEEGSSGDVSIREGSDVFLTCRATGYPSPNITWRREDNEPIPLGTWQAQKFTDPSAIVFEGDTLQIRRVSRLHTGAYLCIAANGIPPSISRRMVLHVNFPPVLWIPNRLVGASLGRTVTLDCHAEAYPSSIDYWGRAAEHMIISNDKVQVITKEKAYKTHIKLIITNLQPTDFGTYKCFSKNSLGSTEGSVELYEIKPATNNPVKDFLAEEHQSSQGFTLQQNLGLTKSPSENSTDGVAMNFPKIDNVHITNFHINTVENKRENKQGFALQSAANIVGFNFQAKMELTLISLILIISLLLKKCF